MTRTNQALAPAAPATKSRRSANEIVPLPPTLEGGTVLRIPPPLHDDVVQEAWVAYLAGQDPNLAVWSYLERLRRAERRCVCFSQLEPRELERIYDELPG